METLFFLILILLILVAIFSFGYKDEYDKNPRAFKRTILGAFGGILSFLLGLFGLAKYFHTWMNEDENPKEKDFS